MRTPFKFGRVSLGPLVALALLVLGADFSVAQPAPADAVPALKATPAKRSASAVKAPLLGATRAGKRIVAVGSYGTVVLSDDGGKTYRQAEQVPVSSTLTSVSFVDERTGWAVGHWGVVLRTEDGGEHWALQRFNVSEDRPLFSVLFFDTENGVAVGLWSQVLLTADGGRTWVEAQLPKDAVGDRNLFDLFSNAKGEVFAAAERGGLLRSADRGKSWQFVDTGYKGSFWTGVSLKSGTVLLGGLRGTLYRSTDGGDHWAAVTTGARNSITDLAEVGKEIVAVGLNGQRLVSIDDGLTFTETQRDDRLPMTAVTASADGRAVVFSKSGVVADPALK